jgi:hypothetical protein
MNNTTTEQPTVAAPDAKQPPVTFLKTPALEEVKIQARRFFDQDDFNKGKPYSEEQGCVNHLRHVCTNYDAIRRTIRVSKLHEDESPEVNALKSQVLDLIEQQYPELKTECLRQHDWLAGRLKAHEYSRYKHGLGVNGNQPVLDLIGAEQAQALEVVKETATVDSLKSELAEMRKMPVGQVFDAVKKLRATTDQVEQLQGEISRHHKLLKDIQCLLSAFAAEKPYTKPVTATVHKSAKNLRHTPEQIKQITMQILKDHGSAEFIPSRELSAAVEGRIGASLRYPISHFLDKQLLEKQGERAATAWRYKTSID